MEEDESANERVGAVKESRGGGVWKMKGGGVMLRVINSKQA